MSRFTFTPISFNPFEKESYIDKIVLTNEPQREIWLACTIGGEASNLGFNESISLELLGNFHIDYFKEAIQALINRHESLRSTVSGNGETLFVYNAIEFNCITIDISHVTNQHIALEKFISEEMLHTFDLENGPLLRCFIHKLADNKHHFTLITHHIICDGWSLGVILDDLSKFYNAKVQQQPLSLDPAPQISHYAEEMLAFQSTSNYKSTTKYWIDLYKDDIPVLDLPTDRERPETRTYNAKRLDYSLSSDLIQSLKSIGTKSGCTLVNTLLSTFEIFLFLKTGQNDVVIGLPSAGQSATENLGLVGHCVNLLPLRSWVDPELTFNDYLKVRKKYFFDAQDNQQFTFGELIKRLNIQRDSSRIPLVPVMFNIDLGMDTNLHFEGLSYKLFSNPRAYEIFEIFLNIRDDKQALILEWSYNTNLFNASTISAMAQEFHHLIDQLIENSDVEIKNLLPFKTAQHALAVADKKDIKSLIGKLADKKNKNILPQTDVEKLVARLWRDSIGLKDDIYVNDNFFDLGGHSLTAVKALLKLEKETGKRLPMTSIFKHSTIEEFVKLLNSEESTIDTKTYVLPQEEKFHSGNSNQDETFSLDFTIVKLIHDISIQYPENIAINFQGLTTNYKDLEIKSNQLAWTLIRMGIKSGDIIGLALDRTPELIVSLLGILKAGATYVPLDPLYPKDRIIFMLEDSAATLLITTSEYSGKFGDTSEVLQEDLLAGLSSFPPDLPKTVIQGIDIAYILYTSGSTGKPKGVQIEHRNLLNFLQSMKKEPGMNAGDAMLAVTTISFDIAGLELYLPLICGAKIILASADDRLDPARIFQLIEQENVSIMQATPATWRMMLNDRWEKKYPIKVLCGGESFPKDLAHELLQRSNSVWNLYGPTETTIWSTIKRITEDEDQITIGHPIDNTQVYILNDDLMELPVDTPGEIYIGGMGVAKGYLNRPELTNERFISNPVDKTDKNKLYRTGDLGKYLPNGEIICLGRIDNQVKIRGYRIELGEIEHHLNKMDDIKEAIVIAREDIPGDQRLVAYLIPQNQNFGINREIIADRNKVKNWKENLREYLPSYMLPNDWIELSSFPLTPNLKIDRKLLPQPSKINAETNSEYELSDVLIVPTIQPQIEIWLAYLMGQDSASKAYNLPFSVEFTGNLNRIALEQALKELVDRHELLRACFSNDGTQIHIQKNVPIELNFKDISDLTETQQQSFIKDFYNQNAETAFDLFKAPLFRLALLKLNENKHNFLFTVHHSIADGWSLDIIFSDLGNLYSAIIKNELSKLSAPSLFSQYSIQQQVFYKSPRCQHIEDFWVEQYKDNIPVLELPADFVRPKQRSFKGNRVYYPIEDQLFQAFKNLGTSVGCSPSISFRAALEIFLYRLTNQSDIVTGMPLAGQLGTDYEEMVAHAVNLLPLKAKIDGKLPFLTYLKERKLYMMDAFENKDLTFSSLLKKLNLNREESRVPLVSVIMNYDYKQNNVVFEGLSYQLLPTQKLYENFDLSLNAEESASGFKIRWDYNADLFTESTITQFNDAFVLLLDTVSKQPDIQLDRILDLGNFLPNSEIQFTGRINQQVKERANRIELTDNNGSSTRPLTGETENIIAKIWSEKLKIDNIKPDDDFFDLGGHSLIAVAVIVAVENKIGKRLPLASLFENSTLEKFAKLIEYEEQENKEKLLVPIKKTGNKTPIYIVHGGGLNVILFNPLGRYMDSEQPVYALQALGLNGETELLYTMEELADRYNAEILNNDPVGPYALAGYSFGGLLVYEMARKLINMGKEIKMLGIFDTYAGGRDLGETKLCKVRKKIIRQFSKLLFFGNSFIKTPGETISYQITIISHGIKSLFTRKKTITDEAAKFEEEISNSYFTASKNYYMKPLDVKVHLFRVKKRIYFLDDPVYLGWKDYALKGVNIHEVSGDHRTFLFPPHDKGFAEILQKALDEN